MSTYTCDVESIHSVAGCIEKQNKRLLALKRGELAGIRFLIVLTGKWEAWDSLPLGRRADLRTELFNLRALYLDKLDEIALEFGVQTAIEIKDEVEHTVAIPIDMTPAIMPIESEQLDS